MTSFWVRQVGLTTGSLTAPDEHAESSDSQAAAVQKAAKHSQHLRQMGCRTFPKFAAQEPVDIL